MLISTVKLFALLFSGGPPYPKADCPTAVIVKIETIVIIKNTLRFISIFDVLI